jgi:hypothetical protein
MLKKKWKIGTLTIEPLGIWVAYGEKNMQDKKNNVDIHGFENCWGVLQ